MYTIDETLEIYHSAINQVTKNKDNFISFLETAAQHYKHNAVNQLMISVQAPNEKLVADGNVWSKLGGTIVGINPIISLRKIEDILTPYNLFGLSDVLDISPEKLAPFLEKWTVDDLQKVSSSLKEKSFDDVVSYVSEETYDLSYTDMEIPISKKTCIEMSTYLIKRKVGIIEKGDISNKCFKEFQTLDTSFDKAFQYINEIVKRGYTNLLTFKKWRE